MSQREYEQAFKAILSNDINKHFMFGISYDRANKIKMERTKLREQDRDNKIKIEAKRLRSRQHDQANCGQVEK